MKILWVCNVLLPEIAKHLGKGESAVGGWLSGALAGLKTEKDAEIIICFPDKEDLQGTADAITFYSFPQESPLIYSQAVEERLYNILLEEKPDVIHIHGTEYPHCLAAVNAAERCNLLERVAVSIQGLVSVYTNHYYGHLPKEIVNRWSFRDVLRRDNLVEQRKKFAVRGEFETAALKKVTHVIGRTDWDRACTFHVNNGREYYFCNETLRKEFYTGTWNAGQCEKHSVFVSQCSYPVKGFHLALEAVSLLKRDYPDVHLYTTGTNPLHADWKGKLRQSAYNIYLGELIQKYGLEENVTFLGTLNAEQMKNRYLASNVFLSASSIENSPNSVGEAMCLGVPTVSSDVGGVKNMLKHGEEGFVYPADAPYMAAYYIGELFQNTELCEAFSARAQKHAKVTHDPQKNFEDLMMIYSGVSKTGV